MFTIAFAADPAEDSPRALINIARHSSSLPARDCVLIGRTRLCQLVNCYGFGAVPLRLFRRTLNTANSEFSKTSERAAGMVAGIPSVRLLTAT